MSEAKTCPNCGAALMPGDVFCGECGVRVKSTDHDIVSPTAPEDVATQTVEESPAEDPVAEAIPTTDEYIPPPTAKAREGDGSALRVVAIVAAVGLLLLSVCLCSFGGFSLLPSEDYPTVADSLGFATALCFVPGVIVGLLGIGAAYFGFRKR